MNRVQQAEPEIREDLQGRIEVFDQSIRSFENRLRAVERRLSLETQPVQRAERLFSSDFNDSNTEENSGSNAANSSYFSKRSSIAPEPSIPANSYLTSTVPLFLERNIPNFELDSVIPSTEVPDASVIVMESSSEASLPGYKIVNVNQLFSSVSESLRALQVALSDLSYYVHNDLKLEVEKLDIEIKNFKDIEEKTNENLKGIGQRVDTIEDQNKLTFGSIRIPLEISGITGALVLFLTGLLVWSGRWDIIRSPFFPLGLAVLMAGTVFIKFYMVNRKKRLFGNRE